MFRFLSVLSTILLLGVGIVHAGEVDNGPPPVKVDNGPTEWKVTKVEVSTPTAPVAKPTDVSYRQAIGHTHTCVNGHTWDHSQDGGSHRCPDCGSSQFIVDSVPKLVPNRTQAVQPVQSAPAVTYSFSSPLNGCANGNCPTTYVPAGRGFFNRR